MHPLRVLLYVSLVIAIAIAWGFSAALQHAGEARTPAVIIGVAVFVAFMLPWMGVSAWAWRRAADLDTLVERARRAAERPSDVRIGDRRYHGEVDDLARAVEELRAMVLRQAEVHEEHRAAMAEIVASLGEGLLAVGPKGRVVFANARFSEMFGAPGELTGRTVPELVRKQPVLHALDRALDGEACSDRVTLGTTGSERQIEVRAVPVASAEIAAVVLFIDITTIERLQRVRKEFLDDFSHEVRTPLAGLKSAAETLEHGGVSREDEQQLRLVMHRQIGRIERLVNDLSELNRIETGELVLQRYPVDVRQTIEELLADFRLRFESIGFDVAGDPVVIHADVTRLQQIFSNLLDNAARHGGGEGRVLVEIGRNGRDAVVSVSDEGPGIPPRELERVFNRFYRVDRSRSQPGTGLGLAIAKHLVALHGGTIRAFNRPNGGATFEVRLPIDLS